MIEEEQKKVKTKLKSEKTNNYSKYVREMYWPKASLKKQLEVQMQKEKLAEINKIRNSINVAEKASAGINSERPWRQAMIIRQKDDNYTDSEVLNRNRKNSDYDNNSISGSVKGRSPRRNHALLN